MSAESLQNEESFQVDHYTNPSLVHSWEWMLPIPIVPEGLSSDYDLTPIPSCSQEAFAPSDNAYMLGDNLANWLHRESSSGPATDTIQEATSVVFETTVLLYNDGWSSEAIGRTPYPDPDSCTFKGKDPSDGIKDLREIAAPAYYTSSRQEDPAFAAKPRANLACELSTETSNASDSCEFNTHPRINSEYCKTSHKNPDRSSRKSPRPTATALAVLEPTSGVTKDSPIKRKLSHSRVEARYRTRLNASFQNLLQALPQKVVEESQVDSLYGSRKHNVRKAEVLELARSHIKVLEERLTLLEEDGKGLVGDLEGLQGI